MKSRAGQIAVIDATSRDVVYRVEGKGNRASNSKEECGVQTAKWLPTSKSRRSRRMGSGKEFADAKIASKKVVVISKSYCPFCKKAKQVLAKYKISDENIEYIEIENRPDMDEIQVGTNSKGLLIVDRCAKY